MLECWSILSGVRCGIEPLDEAAMNVGNVRDHLKDVLLRASSDSERVVFDVAVTFSSVDPFTTGVGKPP